MVYMDAGWGVFIGNEIEWSITSLLQIRQTLLSLNCNEFRCGQYCTSVLYVAETIN